MASTPNDKLARLQTYAEKLKQRLNGSLEKNLREFIKTDLRKTEAQIAKLK
jgi:hypothetical protein